jgi:hypothetical protein
MSIVEVPGRRPFGRLGWCRLGAVADGAEARAAAAAAAGPGRGARKRKDTVARVQLPRRMPRCSAACDAVVCGGSCQCHRGPPWECRVRRDFAPSRQRDFHFPRREEVFATGPWTKTRTLPESRRALVQFASKRRSGVASPVGVTGLRGVDPKAIRSGCMRSGETSSRTARTTE